MTRQSWPFTRVDSLTSEFHVLRFFLFHLLTLSTQGLAILPYVARSSSSSFTSRELLVVFAFLLRGRRGVGLIPGKGSVGGGVSVSLSSSVSGLGMWLTGEGGGQWLVGVLLSNV